MSLSQLTVTYAEIQNLVPYVRNARTHSRRQIRQIADSIRTFGFTNPVLVNGSSKGKIHHREFAMAAGEMSEPEFVDFLYSALSLLQRHSCNGSVHFICMDWRHAGEVLQAGKKAYDRLLNLCVWTKDNGGMGSFYRSQHELIFVFRKGLESHRNNIQLGKFGRNRTNVWRYPGVNTLSRSGDEGNLLALHPTVKPVAMIADAILDARLLEISFSTTS